MKLDFQNQTLRLIVVFVVVLVGSGVLVYALLRASADRSAQIRGTAAPSPEAPVVRPSANAPIREDQPTPSNQDSLGRIFESRNAEGVYASEGFGTLILRIALRLLLATGLGTALAYRPRRKLFALRRNPYVAQTQILLAIVASALMMIVGDNAARAFGIFAAVSLVRFRTNIRDPKEISVLLVSLAIGLATGVGRPELAVILCAFVLAALWILETAERRQVFRAMDLKIVTKDIESSERALKHVLGKYEASSELRALSRDGDDRTGTIVESVNISPLVSTDKISEEILVEDSENITSIEWEEKKSFSYIYQ